MAGHNMVKTLRQVTQLLTFLAFFASLTGAAPSVSDASQTRQCPVYYRRLKPEEVRAGATPYFLGGRVGPKPEKEPNWKAFCAGEGFGAVCKQQTPGKTTRDLVDLILRSGHEDDLLATPCELWQHLEGRTVLLTGDSQMLDFYKAMVCTLREFVDYEAGPPLPPGKDSYGLFKIARPLGFDYTNYLHLQGVPSCVHMKHGTRVCFIRLNRAEEMEQELDLLRTLVDRDDIKIVNFGLHHRPLRMSEEVIPVLRTLAADEQLGTNFFYRDTTPLHFDSIYGDQDLKAPAPFQCKARNLELNSDGTLGFPTSEPNRKGESPEEELMRYNARNIQSLPMVAELGIPIIHTFNQTAILHDYHRNNGSGHECSHYCWPVPGLWVNSMLNTFRASPPTSLKSNSYNAGVAGYQSWSLPLAAPQAEEPEVQEVPGSESVSASTPESIVRFVKEFVFGSLPDIKLEAPRQTMRELYQIPRKQLSSKR